MARLARVVVPNCQHHVIRRGNQRQKTFSELICMVSPDFHHVIRRGNQRQKTFSELICMVSPDFHLYGVPRFPQISRSEAG